MKNGCIEKRLAAIEFRSRQRGASLLEGIAYLGIAAIVILGAVSLLTSAFGNAQANRTTEEVISLRTAVRKLYSAQTYPAAITGTLITARAIPATLTVDQTTGVVNNTWGGTVTVTGQNSPTNNTFAVAYTLVPRAECVNVLSGANGWASIASDSAAAIPTVGVSLTPAQAATLCAAATNTITLTSQ